MTGNEFHLRPIEDGGEDGGEEHEERALSSELQQLQKKKVRRGAINVHVQASTHKAFNEFVKVYDINKGDLVDLALRQLFLKEGFPLGEPDSK